MENSFDVLLGIVSFIVSVVLLNLGIIAFSVSLNESKKVGNQLSVFKTETQQQLSILSQKLEEKEKNVPIYYVIKKEESNKEDENVHNKVECAIPY